MIVHIIDVHVLGHEKKNLSGKNCLTLGLGERLGNSYKTTSANIQVLNVNIQG